MQLKNKVAALTIAVATAAGGAAAYLSSGATVADGFLLDAAVAARAIVWGQEAPPREPVAVVAVDAGSLEQGDLRDYPRAMFAPFWAATIEGLVNAGARVVAFDFLLSFSGRKFDAASDRAFMQQLYRNRERVVLGRSAGTLPARPYLGALRNDASALGMLELVPGNDGVHRYVRSGFTTKDGEHLPGLVAVALAKAGRGAMPEDVLVAPRRHPERLPNYALIDVLRCIEQAPERVREAFKDRIVFIGTSLPEEDRKLTSARWLKPPGATPPAVDGCALAPLGASVVPSRTVPGVYMHALAAEAVLTDQLTLRIGLPWLVAAGAVSGGVGAAIGLVLLPVVTVLVAALVGLAIWAGEVILLQAFQWFPASPALFALAGAVVFAYLVRYVVEDRRRRALQHAFGHYVAPTLVARLMESPDALSLGGETRPVTIMFADLSGFTAMSTRVSAQQLVELTNGYLDLIATQVDETGGYVDKFIGDAVMAMWGAPVGDDDHAYSGVAAALKMERAIEGAREAAESRGEPGFGIKIGVFSGEAVVGNVGSERRYNYTAVGETVNIAARLEGLPGLYDCPVIIGPPTAAAVADRVVLRELDSVAVKGREEPLVISEAVALKTMATPDMAHTIETYEAALACYRRQEFAEARDMWLRMSDDGPAQVMAERAAELLQTLPPADWDGVWRLTTK